MIGMRMSPGLLGPNPSLAALLPSGEGGAQRRMRVRAKRRVTPSNVVTACSARTLTPTPLTRKGTPKVAEGREALDSQADASHGASGARFVAMTCAPVLYEDRRG